MAAGTPVEPIAAIVLPQPAEHVAGAAVTVFPAVPGRESGVRPGHAVAVGPVLYGVVANVERGLAWFRRVTDPDCRVAVTIVPPTEAAVRVRGTGTAGPHVARGRSGSGLLVVDHVPATADVRVGALVITSGKAGFLPAGLQVGRVVGVENPDAGTTWEIDVEPTAEAELPGAVAYLIRRRLK